MPIPFKYYQLLLEKDTFPCDFHACEFSEEQPCMNLMVNVHNRGHKPV